MIPRNARLLIVLGICAISFRAIARPAPLVVIDAHNDTVQTLLSADADFGSKSPDREIDLPRLREGGVTVPFYWCGLRWYNQCAAGSGGCVQDPASQKVVLENPYDSRFI